jgi:hypothetical protein
MFDVFEKDFYTSTTPSTMQNAKSTSHFLMLSNVPILSRPGNSSIINPIEKRTLVLSKETARQKQAH